MPLPFTLPTRVSRLYPIFSLILLLSTSAFFYAWQQTQLEINRLVTFEQREEGLHRQINSLIASQKQDQAKIQVQKQTLADINAKLAEIEKNLTERTSDLSSKEKELSQAQEQLKNQRDQLTTNANELEQLRARPPLFSFQNQSSSLENATQKQEDIKDIITIAYEYIKLIYGDPYLLNSIVVTLTDTLSIKGSSAEIVIENGPNGISIKIRLPDFDKNKFEDVNALVHEILHGFHGIAVFNTTALEEGITIAAADAVMERMIADHKLPQFTHLYLSMSEAQYQDWNSRYKVYADNTVFYTDPNVGRVYQMIGTAWYKLYKEDSEFFKKVNTEYYPKVQQGLTPDAEMVLDAIRAAAPTVDGESIDVFLAKHRAFNPN